MLSIRSDNRGEAARPPAAIFLGSDGVGGHVAFELPFMGAVLTPDINQHHAGTMRLYLERKAAVFEALRACECGRPAGVCHAVPWIVSGGSGPDCSGLG